MKKLVLFFALSIGCLDANSQTFYKITAEAKHAATERPKDADFKSSDGFVSLGVTRIIFYDNKRNILLTMNSPSLSKNNKSLEDLFIITGKGLIGTDPVNFAFMLKSGIDEPNTLRITFPNTGKGVTYLLVDM